MRVEKRENARSRKPRGRKVRESREKPTETVTVSDDFKIPGTNYVIEEGDVIDIFEAKKGSKKKSTRK